MSRGLAVALTVTLVAGGAFAQPAKPRVTSVVAIHADPAAFHGTLVRITGTVTRKDDHQVLTHSGTALRLLSPDAIPTGDVEVQGVVLDIGRLTRDDAQLASLQATPLFDRLYRYSWPAPGEEIAVAVKSVAPQSREVVGIAVTPVPPLPLDLDFSVPIEGEADVRLDSRVRLQFSRDVNVSSFEGRLKITYSQPESVERGEAQPPELAFTFTYNTGTRTLELRPTVPLARFRQVKVELLEGIVGMDGSVLRPWSLNFSTGGS